MLVIYIWEQGYIKTAKLSLKENHLPIFRLSNRNINNRSFENAFWEMDINLFDRSLVILFEFCSSHFCTNTKRRVFF